MAITVHTEDALGVLQTVGQLTARVMAALQAVIKPGVSTGAIDALAVAEIQRLGATPAFLGYQPAAGCTPYPAAICASVNEEVLHGIPGQRRLQEGDLVSIDVGLEWGGYYGDMARTFAVGQISPERSRLLDTCQRALRRATRECRVGRHLGDVEYAIASVARAAGVSVVTDYCGHGIGRQLHEEPQVQNTGRPGTGERLQAGMVLALEPMLNLGCSETRVGSDGWTVTTRDGKCSAHFEDCVAVTPEGPLVLTATGTG